MSKLCISFLLSMCVSREREWFHDRTKIVEKKEKKMKEKEIHSRKRNRYKVVE